MANLHVNCISGHNLADVKGKKPNAYLSVHLVNSAATSAPKVGGVQRTPAVEAASPEWKTCLTFKDVDRAATHVRLKVKHNSGALRSLHTHLGKVDFDLDSLRNEPKKLSLGDFQVERYKDEVEPTGFLKLMLKLDDEESASAEDMALALEKGGAVKGGDEEAAVKDDELDGAARKIQAIQRGRKERKHAAEKEEAATKLQARYRQHAETKHQREEEVRAATLIQSRVRVKSAKSMVNDRRASVRHDTMKKLFIAQAKRGINIVKHGRAGKGKVRQIKLSDDEGTISWPGRNKTTVDVNTISEVRPGRGTKILQKSAKDVDESLLFSLIAEERTVDLQAESEAERDELVGGFRALISRGGD